MVFAIPFAVLEQATFRLQFVVTGAVTLLAKLIGIKIAAVGTTLTAADRSFDFEIAEGCSGIKSIIAMSMLTAVYVHVTQREMWKKALIFAASVPFAIVGNIGRIFTVVLVARFIDKDIAGGIYHDYSGFVFFPVALGAMVLFARLLNTDLGPLKKQLAPPPTAPRETKTEAPTTPDDIY
jgi:exosortase